MKCDKCDLESEIISQLLAEQEGDKINTRTPMVWKCSNGHITHREYDNLKKSNL